ncbi:MAG: hypothetical protein ACOYMA_18925, partial [Bacteroidia bacterium]
MKKTTTLFALVLLFFSSLYAQTAKQIEPSFSTQIIKTSDLIVEGTITSVSYFRDTSTTVRNIRFNGGLKDAKGIWFIKYEITIHKLFKGEKLSKITVVDFCSGSASELDSLLVYPISRGVNRNRNSNYNLNYTAIFFLTKSFILNLPFDNNFFYLNEEQSSVGFYHLITENHIKLRDKGELKEFETLANFYKYLEKEIGKKRIDITNKKFEIINTQLKYEEYLKKYFNDSAYTNNYSGKIREGKINQLNIDSFRVKPKPPLSKKMLIENKRIRDSINVENKKRYLENKNLDDQIMKQRKQGSLNKTVYNLVYTFANSVYSKSGSDVFLEYDILGQADVTKYFAAIALNISYNPNVFGSSIYNSGSGGLTITRGSFLSNATNYPNVTILDPQTSTFSVVIEADYGTTLPKAQLNANTLVTLLHIKMKVLSTGFGLMTGISISSINQSQSGKMAHTSNAAKANWDLYNVTSSSTENHKAALPEITSLSKTSVVGGVGEILEINGRFFGTVKERIQFKAAETTKNTNFGNFISLDDYDYTWTENKITVKVPSLVTLLNENVMIGTGPIRIYNTFSPSIPLTSTQTLEIKYSLFNYILKNSSLVVTDKFRAGVAGTGTKTVNGIDFVVHQAVFNNQDAMKCIIAAMKKWSCETGMNWNITKVVNSLTTSSSENLISYGSSLMTKTMVTNPIALRCNTNSPFYNTFSIEINPSLLYSYSNTQVPPSASHVDFYGAILHELGHCIGLDHTVNLTGYDLMYWTLNIPRLPNTPLLITN